MGWRYNESGKYWYKPGIVDKKGKWLNIPKGTPKAGSYILTEEEREEIRQTYDGDQDEFMSKYNISKYNLNSALKGRGSVGRPFLDKERRENGGIIYDQVPPENRKVPFKKRMTENEKLEVIQMAEEGTDHWEIANEFERSITTIRKIIYKDNEKQRENRQRR